jgi:N-acetyl-gamma-glutamyl-phosphate reductase
VSANGNGKLRVGVVGGSGYSGGELCRLLLGHPHVGEIVPTSRGEDPFERVHPNLLGSGLEFTTPDALLARARATDAVFFCTPSGEAMAEAPRYLEQDVPVIDLSADYRFKDAGLYESVYGEPHVSPDLLDEAVYGATELYRSEIAGAHLVANPGCYVITGILALAPLLGDERVDLGRLVRVNAVNGTTGAGTTPKREIMHAEAANDVLPYSLEGHRHGPELEEQLERIAGCPVRVDLNTAHGNFARGIYLQASVEVADGHRHELSRDELIERYRDFYGDGSDGARFVVINQFPKRGGINSKEYSVYPSMARVAGSNFCHIGLDYDAAHGVIKVVAVTDNLVKGAAGSAIQNMNVMLGLAEAEGLGHYGL